MVENVIRKKFLIRCSVFSTCTHFVISSTYVRKFLQTGRATTRTTTKRSNNGRLPKTIALKVDHCLIKAPMSFLLFLFIRSSIMIDDSKKKEAHWSFITNFRGSLRSNFFPSAIESIASKKNQKGYISLWTNLFSNVYFNTYVP